MCDRPILIDNPYLGLEQVGLNRFHDCHSLKIPVPCGNCPTCISLRQSYFIQRVQMESINHHLFMMTLTYRDSMIRYKDVNGRRLYYADFTDVQKMFKRLRNRGLNFRYLVVNEYGGLRHRPHFHALISVPKNGETYHDILNLEWKLSDMFIGEWRRNYGSDKKPIYKQLCQLVVTPRGRTYDFHYVNPALTKDGESDVAFYVTKYVCKADEWVDRLKSALKLNLPPQEFEDLWKLLKPRLCISKGFGDYSSPDVIKHIRKGIDLALSSDDALFPYFINPVTGQTFPLAPVFQRRFLTLQDKEVFFSRGDYSDGYHESDERNPNMEHVRDEHLSHIRKNINSKLTSYDFVNDFSEVENLNEKDIQTIACDNSIVVDDWTSSREDF